MTDLARYGPCTLDEPAPAKAGDGCTTCGDFAVPVRVVERRGDAALCEDRTGARAEVATAFTPEAAPGDVLLVHMRVAIAHLSAARETP